MNLEDNTNFFFTHIKIINEYKKLFEDISNTYDLTATEIDIITFLINNTGYENTASEISYYRGLTKSMISKSVAALTEKGIVLSTPSEKDKRYMILTLSNSKESQEITEKVKEVNRIFGEQLYSNIKPEDFNTYLEVTEQMYQNIRKEI